MKPCATAKRNLRFDDFDYVTENSNQGIVAETAIRNHNVVFVGSYFLLSYVTPDC